MLAFIVIFIIFSIVKGVYMDDFKEWLVLYLQCHSDITQNHVFEVVSPTLSKSFINLDAVIEYCLLASEGERDSIQSALVYSEPDRGYMDIFNSIAIKIATYLT